MNLHAVYFSPTQTTKTVVEAVCQGMGQMPTLHDITLWEPRQLSLDFHENDCLVMGLPVYAGRIPKVTEAFIHKLRGHHTPAIILAVYGNRAYEDALLEMQDLLKAQGFDPVAGGAFIGEHSYTHQVGTNRPDAKDIDTSIAFGKKLIPLLEQHMNSPLSLTVSGNFPYRQRPQGTPQGPTIKDTCTKCGSCVDLCPTHALQLDGKILVNDALCISCHRCKKNCPVGAIEFGERIGRITEMLESKCRQRKEPELFFGA